MPRILMVMSELIDGWPVCCPTVYQDLPGYDMSWRGCGSTDVTWCETDRLFDCNSCGHTFTVGEAVYDQTAVAGSGHRRIMLAAAA